MTIATTHPDTDAPAADGRSKRLKQATGAIHERLDRQMMAASPFSSRERYVRYLRLQYLFHREVAPLYRDPGLAGIFPDLAQRRRLELVAADLMDLGEAPPPPSDRAGPEAHDLAPALGWLYVAEGSNLGAAFLLKAAGALGLSESWGARHLRAAPEGRGLQWRTFTHALDGVELSAGDEDRVVDGARHAFAFVLDRAEMDLKAA
ncbi:biliverdin-producing heme oxygenase [Jiella sonneratiae]|uniref:Biliverdin-producing heme oxygenase n=1 Tax=Jiella sonneratiae TaxID=2816856 RepID=A0ABS3J8S3_9HYPH|nr:biliverdin-producing heme oxygenase [Jiella sonneratiae]MBO0906072.1 biliverdin-producing heme oxygenase [Jiella sonneratiae]